MVEKRNVYVGHRYVPKVMGEWDNQETYEGLSIVTYQGASYTSKKRVPVGIDISNEEYWVVTGNYNAQIEEYREEVKGVSKNFEDNKKEVSLKLDQKETLINKNVKDTEAIPNDENFDNANILKELFENNNFVHLEGKYYTSSITVDRTGKPKLTISGDFELIGKFTNMEYVLKFENGVITNKGKIKINGSNLAHDGLKMGFGTSHSNMGEVFIYSVLRNGVYNEYVTANRFELIYTESCGNRLSTNYKKITDTSEDGINGFSTIQVDGVDDKVFSLDHINFVIIENVLYKVLKTLKGSSGEKLLEIYPRNTALNTNSASCKILIGAGFYDKGTGTYVANLDLRACGMGIYRDGIYGSVYSNSIFQGTPVGVAYGKEGIGNSLSQNNALNEPYFENNIPFPVVTSLSSKSGVNITEPFTTNGNLKFLNKFGDYSPVVITKNGKVYQNNRISKFYNDSNSKYLIIGDDLLIKNDSSYTTPIDVVISTGAQEYLTNTRASKIFVHNTTRRPINIVAEGKYTVENSNHKSVNALKGVIHILLDNLETDYSVFYNESESESETE